MDGGFEHPQSTVCTIKYAHSSVFRYFVVVISSSSSTLKATLINKLFIRVASQAPGQVGSYCMTAPVPMKESDQYVEKNIERHTACTIDITRNDVSYFDSMMIIRQSTRILTIITEKWVSWILTVLYIAWTTNERIDLILGTHSAERTWQAF